MANAGKMEPGVSYVYEKADGVTYARKVGDPPDARFEIGRDYNSEKLHKELMDAKMWGQIHRAAETNPALQEALDRVIIVYELSRQDEFIMHHPV
jgi:hypothetical protein